MVIEYGIQSYKKEGSENLPWLPYWVLHHSIKSGIIPSREGEETSKELVHSNAILGWKGGNASPSYHLMLLSLNKIGNKELEKRCH